MLSSGGVLRATSFERSPSVFVALVEAACPNSPAMLKEVWVVLSCQVDLTFPSVCPQKRLWCEVTLFLVGKTFFIPGTDLDGRSSSCYYGSVFDRGLNLSAKSTDIFSLQKLLPLLSPTTSRKESHSKHTNRDVLTDISASNGYTCFGRKSPDTLLLKDCGNAPP